MHIHVHVYQHSDKELIDIIKDVRELLVINNQKLNQMADELLGLTDEVTETKGIMQSAKVLIVGFRDALDKAIAANNPQALIDLRNDLNTGSEDLAAAIAANPLPGEVVTPPEG